MWFWVGSITMMGIALLVFRLVVRMDYRKGKLSGFAIALEFLVFALHANLPYLYLNVLWPELPPLPESLFLTIPGVGLIAVGTILTLATIANLGFSTTLGQKPLKLRQTGPYHRSRNPQILAYGLVIAGFVILYPSLQAGVWLVLYCFAAHLMVAAEEEYLGRIFKAAYRDYCRRVPRYFPFPRLGGILAEIKKE